MFTPKLRFPEFHDMDTWEEKQLGSICKAFSGGTPLTTQKEFYGGSIPFIRSAEIDKKVTELFLTDEGFGNSSAKLINKGDVLVALYGANSGEVALAKIDGAINQAILCLKSQESQPYIYQFLLFKKNWIVSKYIQGGQGNLSSEIIKSIKIQIPKPKEQQKIADCLSSLDDLITAETQKLDAFKDHKKGLMQQLFPGEGEMVPKLRFEEFRGSGEWEEKTLGSICSNIASGKDRIAEDGEFNLYGSTGIIGKTNSISYNGNFILVARVGANAGLLTKANSKFGVTDNTLVLFLNDSENLDFVFYSLERFGLNKLVFGSGQPLITGGQLKSLIIYLPKPKEQNKIAECLFSLEELITAQTEKIAELQKHKKGLLQGLFPKK